MGKRGGRCKGAPMTREVQVSKKLSRLLRHSAEQEGLSLGPGGYVNLGMVLNTQALRSLKVTFPEIRDIVRDNEKQRFSLIPVTRESDSTAAETATPTTTDSEDPSHYLIRANQGHSIEVATDGLLTPVTAADIPTTCVHGTTYAAWPLILRSGGLRKMNRTHIHFAAGLPAGFRALDEPAVAGDKVAVPVISGMRNSSTVLVYVDVGRAMEAGIQFFRSENGVLLSAGGEDGVLPLEFFSKVEDRKRNVVLVRDGKVVEGADGKETGEKSG